MESARRAPKTYVLVATAVMSTISIILDVLPLPRAVWGMKIDLVGTVWVLSFFLYGLKSALGVASMTTVYIAMFSSTGYVGAIMKFIATIPMFLVPALVSYLPFFSNRSSKIFNKPLLIVGLCVLANAVRLLVTTTVNYYWAIPLWTGIPTEKILATMFNDSMLAFIVFIAGMNVFQGIVDIIVPWALAFQLKLSRYFGTW